MLEDINAKTWGINRRGFLIGAAAMAGPTPLLAATAPKKGGTFRMGVISGDVAQNLDPTSTAGALDQMVQMMTRNGLVEILPNGELGPELAERWESDASLKKWTFFLRKGVTFHNGKTLTSADVIYSIKHHLGENSKSPIKATLGAVTSVAADGPDRVVVELSGPNADLPFVFGDYYMRIIPDGATSFIDGNGTGPYALTSFEPGVRASGKRNPNYFKPDRAHFDAISLLVVADESARIAALNTGQIDAMDRVGFKILPMVQNAPGIKVLEAIGRQHFNFPMLCDQAPFDNRDLRLAMKYGIDREAILKLVLNGRGYVGNDHPIARNAKYFNSELKQRVYDPDRARFHLKNSGLAGTSLQLHVSEAAFAGATDTGSLYKEAASKAGINFELVRAPNDGYWAKVWQKVPWFTSWWAGRPTEDWMLTSTYAKGSPYNESHWSNDRFNQLLVAARGESDEAKRRQMYWEMQQLISDDGGTITPVFANYVTLVSAKIAYGDVSAMWILDGYKATERWWFA